MTFDETDAPIYLVSERFGHSGGGEAIKAYQYAKYLLSKGRRVVVFTHYRSVSELGGDLHPNHLRLVKDSLMQKAFWHSRVLRLLLQPYFHLQVRRLILAEAGQDRRPILHYISPISPVAPRFAPRGFRLVFGPMTGNIYYPPGFRHRMPLKEKLRERLHNIAQKVLGRILPEKKRAMMLLVSGYERTRASLELAGCDPSTMADVVDSGVSSTLIERPRIVHAGQNTRFMCSARLISLKGIDLAIRAVAEAEPDITLDIYGEGEERFALKDLVASLGLIGRVSFKGWVQNDELMAKLVEYRGYVFPSLMESNGIVMQEAMMAGLPVVAMKWGGPSRLADDSSAVYISPISESQVISDIAKAINRLANDGEYADQLAFNARQLAESRFDWNAVAESWENAYSGSARPQKNDRTLLSDHQAPPASKTSL